MNGRAVAEKNASYIIKVLLQGAVVIAKTPSIYYLGGGGFWGNHLIFGITEGGITQN